ARMKLRAATLPFWIDSADLPSYPRLARDESVDVAVVGGGISGLTAAYLLTLDGHSVALLERDRCAQIDTGHTSAPLTMVTGEQARFHPRKYLAALAHAITDRGGMIFERSSADEFSDRPVSVKSHGHTITCRWIVLATHTPLVGNAGMVGATMFQTKLAYYSS